ncbi:hypothetical protein [Phyllobacterium zundukense]|uniref:Uncharacterized protein n=1 Tax=Phyllobacterium zundukense TaxID=1867719 RepID=A0ACD4D7B4_9HYPH|nr:hypothetical protein [Phyllobacterium zundukense]UXN61736.1 hypothetical protein N8E88_16960 [Phyllobacterium zundukense]
MRHIGQILIIGAAVVALTQGLARYSQGSDVDRLSSGSLGFDKISFAETVQRWNGHFLWEPASASGETITRFGDETRAVFGPIPDGDCTDGAAKTIPLQIDGNLVDLKPNPGKAGHPLEFEHRDIKGKVVKWTSGVARCDKPSLTGSATYCGLNSRLNRVENGNVEWLFLCRKSSHHLEVEPIPYWQRSNPKFALFGIIGFNRRSGEIVFFDGRKDWSEFDWSQKFVPPGGHSYHDNEGRAAAEALYDPTFQVQCSACHDNKGAYVINPNIQQARVGYLAGNHDPKASAFSLGSLLPAAPRRRSTPFRVIGSGYTATYRVDLERAMTVQDPTGNCTECHTLTTQTTGQRFAADAVARDPVIAHPKRSQFLRLKAEQRKLREINSHRTKWASRSGPGKIHPWMVPIDGNELSAAPPEISASDWSVLSNCLWGAGGDECAYTPLYTSCPTPGVAAQGDHSKPEGLSIDVVRPPGAEAIADRVVGLSWRYLNSYGNVPQRDDVRFNVAVKSTEIPMSGAAPSPSDYPGLEQATDKNFVAIDDETGTSGSAMLIRNVSYFGHSKLTDPVPSKDMRTFRLDLPAQCNRRYLVRIMPKRFCFDQSNITYGQADHVLYADVSCE